MIQYQNPIIRGFNPDPSICRVGEDYYVVTSTFEFFPGVPIYHSKNLVEWELISYCLTTDKQLPLQGGLNSGGIYAPTLRYNDGVFYMITTNVSGKGNFIVYTRDIRGPWSEPVYIDHMGIDPSLFFDDDGKVYFCGTHYCNDRQGIVLFEIDPVTGKRLSEAKTVTYGNGGKYPEAPHLYKINGFYYLMIAEGGTEYSHMETVFRATSPWGPYESCPRNPILSHRDSMNLSIQATGHADIVEDTNGNWWLVCLGIRPLPSVFLHNLGRETFLSPLTWDKEGWPVIGDGGVIALSMQGPLPGPTPHVTQTSNFEDDFTGDSFKLDWNFVRNPRRENYRLLNGRLCLSAGSETLSDLMPTFMGVRQKEWNVRAQTKVTADSCCTTQAGITAYYNNDYYYAFYVSRDEQGSCVVISGRVHGMECVSIRKSIPKIEAVELRIEADQKEYRFSYRVNDEWVEAGTTRTAGLCTEGTMTMTFTGTYLGVFASGTEAYFDYFFCQIT